MTTPTNFRTVFLAGACFLIGQSYQAKAQGQLDGTFQVGTGPNQPVEAIAVQPDGKILIGGGFTFCNGVARPGIARLNEDGSLDTSFDPGQGANGVVRDIAIRPDGKILIAGDFTTYAGSTSNRIALVNPNGVPETSFNAAGVDAPIFAMELDGSGNIVIGGQFTHCQGQVRNKVARLNANGNLDMTFDPGVGADGTVFALLPVEDSNGYRILLGGDFSTFNANGPPGLVILSNDGTIRQHPGVELDAPGIASVRVIVKKDAGHILIGGRFTAFDQFIGNAFFCHGLAMAQEDETGLVGFVPYGGEGFDDTVRRIAVAQDGQVYISGSFQHFDGVARDGFARLNGDLSLDQTFDPGTGANGAGILSMAFTSDWRVLIGGGFTQYGGNNAARAARICPDIQRTWYPDTDGDGIGTSAGAISTCGVPPGYVLSSGDDCPNLPGDVGFPCDDGDPTTIETIINASCQCAGGIAAVSGFPYEENFSNGLNGFDVVRWDGPDRWRLGPMPGSDGPCLFISDNGVDHHYATTNGAFIKKAYVFRTIQFPASAASLQMSFDWIGMGEPGQDFLRVWLGNLENGGPWNFSDLNYFDLDHHGYVDVSGELSGQGSWTATSLPLPASFIGRTCLLLFEWRTNSSGGTQPPAAIDNIGLCATTPWYGDADADGLGDPAVPGPTTCGPLEAPVGYASNALDDCPAFPGRVGSACDDGNPNTVVDVLGLNCTCAGTGIPWSEDFSNGAGGFTTSQAAQSDRWYWGHAQGNAQPGWFISADGGATLSYDATGTPSISHLLHDLPVIPANATSVQLGFDRLGQAFTAEGHLKVWLVPASFTPTAGTAISSTGTAPSGRVLLADYQVSLISGWITQALTFPTGYAGTSPRLVFEWQDSGTAPSNTKPTAIDNIHLCVITANDGDADNDGMADCVDPCPALAGLHNGQNCDDGNPTTLNDVVTDCVCAGQPLFSSGGIVALRVGNDANDALVATGDPIRLIGFDSDLVQYQHVSIPASGTNPLIITGNSALEGALSLSADSTQLVFAGYAKSLPSTTTLASSTGTAVPRAIGTVDAAGTYVRAATSTTLFGGGAIRAAAANGTDLWAVGSNQGVNYFGGGAPATIATGKTSLQTIGMFGGQLFTCASSVSGTPNQIGVYKVGNNAPTTTGQTLSTLINSANGGTTSFYLNNAATIGYVAIGAGGIQKWVNSGGTWTKVYTLTFSQGAHNVIADFSGVVPVLYTTSNDASQLLKIIDPNSGTGNVAVTPQVFANAGTNHAWRGLAFAPRAQCTPQTWYADVDGDGFGVRTDSITQCAPAPPGTWPGTRTTAPMCPVASAPPAMMAAPPRSAMCSTPRACAWVPCPPWQRSCTCKGHINPAPA